MTAPETGESTASIVRRMADRNWPDIQNALLAGAVLRRPVRMTDFYTEGLPSGDRRNGRCFPATHVKRLEKQGVLVRVGVDTYGLGARL